MQADDMPPRGPSHPGTWLGFAIASLALHAAALTQYGWFRDEFYYVACARHLAWGYVDQPPLSIAILALVRAVAGESLVALRLTAALAASALLYLIGRLTRELGGGRFAQALACLAALLAPVYLGTSRFYSMNVFDLLLWTAAALALVVALRHGRARDGVALGVVLGLGLLNKVSMMWFGLGLLTGLIFTEHRRQLARPWPWIAAAIAALLFAPHVLWQVAHDWPTLEFMRNAATRKMVPVSVVGFLLGQFREMGPANLLVYLPGLLYALFSPAGRRWRVLGIVFVVVAGLLVAAGTSRASYLAAAYPMLLALGGVAWERWSTRRPLARPIAIGAITLLGLPWVPLALPILPIESYLRYQKALGLAPSTEERTEVGPLPQHYADMFGWNELVALVAEANRRLTPEERRRAVVFGQNYGEAGAVDVLGRKLGLPRVISGHNNYYLWGPGDWDGRVMIIVGGDPEDNAAWFESIERVGTWNHPYAMPYERGLGIFIARGFKYPPAQVWPKLKRYI